MRSALVLVVVAACEAPSTERSSASSARGAPAVPSPLVADVTLQGSGPFGTVVAPADLDHDGYVDLAVSNPMWSNPQDGEGQVSVFRGSAAGPSTSAAVAPEGNARYASLGFALAALDADGDGLDDLVVGTLFGLRGFYGSALGPAAVPGWSGAGPSTTGATIANAGDLDGDGYEDLVVGDGGWSSSPLEGLEGRAFVYRGGPGGLEAAASWTWESNERIAAFGEAVAAAGDVDGDGFGDLVVGGYAAGAGGRGQAWWDRGGPPRRGRGRRRGLGLLQPAAYDPSGGLVRVFLGGPDRDADGTRDVADCLPDDPDGHPGAPEVWYDGVDQDCLGDSDDDADADGHDDVEEGGDDCDDDDPAAWRCTTLTGACPGPVQATVAGLTPGAPIQLHAGPGEGAAVVLGGPCAGTPLGLASPLRTASTTADAGGVARWSIGAAPGAACGQWVVAVDQVTCEVSVPASLP